MLGFTTCTTLANKAYGSSPDTTITQQEKKVADWNVICYFNGDNNLGTYMVNIIDRLERKSPSSENVNVLVLYDGYEQMNPDWKGTKFVHVKEDMQDGINSPMIDKGELDMGSPGPLENLIKEALTKYPSKKNMLIFFSHGYGTVGDTPLGYKKRFSLSPDNTSNSGLTIEETHLAIKRALDAVNKGKKLDAIVMMSCVTNMLGFNYPFRDITKVVVGSEDVIQFDRAESVGREGINIWAIVQKLKECPDINKEELTKHIIDTSMKPYKKILDPYRGKDPKDINVTTLKGLAQGGLAGIDNEKMDGFMVYFNEFSDLLKGKLENIETQKATVNTLAQAVRKTRRYFGVERHDLYNLLEEIEKNTSDKDIKATSSKVRAFLKEDLIIYERYEYFYPELNSHGLSIFIPYPTQGDDEFRKCQDYYKDSEFARDTSWDEVIDLYKEGVKKLSK